MEPRFPILFQTAVHNALQRGRHVLIRLRKIWWLFLQDCAHRFGCRYALKRATARKHLVENGAKGKDVRTMICRLTAQLLRSHVSNRAHYSAWICVDSACGKLGLYLRSGGSGKLRQTEVQNLEPFVPGEKQILGFKVPVEDSFFVRRRQPMGKLARVINRLTCRKNAAVVVRAACHHQATLKLHKVRRHACPHHKWRECWDD